LSNVYPQGTSLYVIVLGQAEDDGAAGDAAGASIVHHHGVGLVRPPWFARELASTHVLLKRLKAAIDPKCWRRESWGSASASTYANLR